MSTKAHEHAYGSTVIPSSHSNGGLPVSFPLGGPPGVPSIIPGSIGVAGSPKVIGLDAKSTSSIAQIVDDFCEKLAGAIAGRVVELVRSELGDRAAPDKKIEAVASMEAYTEANPLLAALAAGQTVTPAANSLLAKEHERIEAALRGRFGNDDRVRFLRYAPEAPAIRVVGFNTANEFGDGGCHEIIVTASNVDLRLCVTAAGKNWYGIKTKEDLLAAVEAVAQGATPCECWRCWDWPGPFNKYTQRRREQLQRYLDNVLSVEIPGEREAREREMYQRQLEELDRVWAHEEGCFRPVDYTTDPPRSREDSMAGLDFVE